MSKNRELRQAPSTSGPGRILIVSNDMIQRVCLKQILTTGLGMNEDSFDFVMRTE